MAFRSDADYFPDSSFAQSVFSFVLYSIHGEVSRKDYRIEATVGTALRAVFTAYPETILVYTCSLTNRQEAIRSRLFSIWYNKYGLGFTKLDFTQVKSRIHTSAVFKNNHPADAEIRQVFVEAFRDK